MQNMDTALAASGPPSHRIGKIAAPAAIEGYIASAGLPAALLSYLIAVIIEVGGGVLLIVGFQIVGFQRRIAALILAVFTLVAALSFHNKFADQNGMIHFLKDIAILGGLLQVAAFGPGSVSFDSRRLNLAQ
jgi:putative oxidoreductase